jgi:hypothetical protein
MPSMPVYPSDDLPEPAHMRFLVNGQWYEVEFANGDVFDCRRKNLKLVPAGQALAPKHRAPRLACILIEGDPWFLHDHVMKRMLDERWSRQAQLS